MNFSLLAQSDDWLNQHPACYYGSGIKIRIRCKNCYRIDFNLNKMAFWVDTNKGEIRISYFEDKGRLQADSNGIEI